MWLRVNENAKLQQVMRQVEKLPDVLALVHHPAEHEIFSLVGRFTA
jgi:acetolactate synthase-1/3 small subunit